MSTWSIEDDYALREQQKLLRDGTGIGCKEDELELVPELPTLNINTLIKSDGGSSSYYFTELPEDLIKQIVKTGGIEIKDIARYVYDNNADAFNIIKAQKRIIEANKGAGKAGITKLYDANKIVYFANEQLKAVKREGTNE